MEHTTRAAWIGVLSLTMGMTVVGQTLASSADPAAVDLPAAVIGTPTDLDDLAWAHERFAMAGLDVPKMAIEFHEDDAACEGQRGTVRTDDDGRRVLRICADHGDPGVRRSWRRKTLIHELAHVWEQRTVDDAARAALLELRGLVAWNDRSMPWEERGTEHAAEIITWAVGEQSWRIDVRLADGCNELAEGYELLTSSAAPHLNERSCE